MLTQIGNHDHNGQQSLFFQLETVGDEVFQVDDNCVLHDRNSPSHDALHFLKNKNHT